MIRTSIKQILSCATYAWLIWFVASLFYGLEYFQRVSPSVMAEPLMATFHINAETLGFIISFYFYAYACAQIPVGILLDKYGARILLTLSCLIISLGTLIFALAKLLVLLAIARLLIGFGSAFAFTGVLKLAGNWYSSRQFPLMVGLTNTLGVLGAIFGQEPLASMVDNMGWSLSLIYISILGFIISFLLWVIIQDKPEKDCEQSLAIKRVKAQDFKISTSIKSIFLNKQTWLTALYAGLMVAPIIAFGELWGVPFLRTDFHVNAIIAADLNTAIFVGIGVGGPLNGWLSGKFKNPKMLMYAGNLVALLCLVILIYLPMSYFAGAFVLFMFGYSTSSMLIAFSINKERHLPQYSALVIAFTNMIIMLLGAIYQPLIGRLLDTFLQKTSPGNFTLLDFHHALIILPITSIISLLIIMKIKITHANF